MTFHFLSPRLLALAGNGKCGSGSAIAAALGKNQSLREPLRPRLHQKIKEQLHDLTDNGVEDVRILVVKGLGRVDKSQLMLNYIHEYRRDYTAIF